VKGILSHDIQKTENIEAHRDLENKILKSFPRPKTVIQFSTIDISSNADKTSAFWLKVTLFFGRLGLDDPASKFESKIEF
jgi:hypothetical protein